MKLALLVAGCTAALVACSGIEEIALNPQGSGAGSAGASVTSASSGGGSTSQPSSAGSGVTPGGGMPSTAGFGGGAGQPIAMPSDGGTNSVACADDDSCPGTAPYCRADGKCVVCLNDSHCTGEEAQCELVTGSCVDPCPGSGGAESGGNCSGM